MQKNAPRGPILLYVDDEWSNRVVFEQSFGSPFHLKTVASAAEALELMRTEVVAVLVSDQRMPDMNGVELLAVVKRSYPETVRMIVTAYSELDPILRAVNEGLVARYVVKPWDRDELERTLAWGLEAYRLGKEDSQIQARLLATERLAAVGSVAAVVLHDLYHPISFFDLTASHLIGDLAPLMPSLLGLLAGHPAELSKQDREGLRALASELPKIGHDMKAATRFSGELLSHLTRMVRPIEHQPAEAPAEPVAAIRFAISMSMLALTVAEARLAYDGPPELPRVRLGQTELVRVLINLITNAAQAVGRNESEHRLVTVGASELEREVRICITDNGPGMTPDVLAQVGKQFFSLRQGGTGLGVNQSRRLIESVEGRLTISSTPGRGSDFAFVLPKA